MKGQMTLFIIIGILIVIAFGITIYAANKVRGVADQPAQLERLGAQPVQDYISTCLNLASTEAFQLLGKQGGFIYESEGGTQKSGNTFEFEEANVTFLILPPEGNVGELFFSQPSRYPFDGFPYTANGLLFKGYYGRSNLPPLYRLTPDKNEVNNSIQESLEKFIAAQTVVCADWSAFKERGYKITAGTANASLVFASAQEQFEGEQYVSIQLNWPVEITTPGGDKVIISNFADKISARLATVYYKVKEIIDADVTDISYVSATTETFSIERIESTGFTVLKLKDTLSSVSNRPFEFWIARKNRIPALWEINTTPLNEVTFHVSKEGTGAKFSINGNKLEIWDPCQEQPIPQIYTIELNASDPDEDDFTFKVELSKGENEIPLSAISEPFSMTITAMDKGEHFFDSQTIQLEIALCEVD